MKKLILFCLVALTISKLEAQTRLDLNVDLIPKELRLNANAVIRNEEQITEVVDLDNVLYKKKTTITILNSRGEDFAQKVVFYDKSISVKYVKGIIYDRHGSIVTKIPESKFRDLSYSGESLFTDNRLKVYTPVYSDYPFTVEYESLVKYKNSFYFQDWIPQRSSNIAVEKSSYSFICGKDFTARIKEYNYKGERIELADNRNIKTYKWTASNLKALTDEEYSPLLRDLLTIVKIAPVTFKYEGISGNFTNWSEYGQWFYSNILSGRETLPEETKIKIKELVKNKPTPVEKAKAIYEYVQNKTRYVSIQKGIGGIQPMKAEEVDRLSYGDCKALSYYMHSLLKVVEIESHYAEIYAGPTIQDITSDFAALQGDHVILCVPFEKDTVWLECTNQTIPFGYLGTFTDNRKAILCTEKGGIIAKTKSYSPKENTQIRKATFKMDSEGNMEGKMHTEFQGIQYRNRDHLVGSSGKERTESILKLYSINNIEIRRFDIKQHKLDNPVTTEEFEFFARNYGAKSNNRIFLMVNPLNQFSNFLKDQGGRKNPIWVSRGFLDEDVLEYLLPEDYQIELLPKNIDIKNEFGEFSCKVSVSGNKLIYQRKMLLNEGTYPSDRYEELRKYYLTISAADQQKVVLVKN